MGNRRELPGSWWRRVPRSLAAPHSMICWLLHDWNQARYAAEFKDKSQFAKHLRRLQSNYWPAFHMLQSVHNEFIAATPSLPIWGDCFSPSYHGLVIAIMGERIESLLIDIFGECEKQPSRAEVELPAGADPFSGITFEELEQFSDVCFDRVLSTQVPINREFAEICVNLQRELCTALKGRGRKRFRFAGDDDLSGLRAAPAGFEFSSLLGALTKVDVGNESDKPDTKADVLEKLSLPVGDARGFVVFLKQSLRGRKPERGELSHLAEQYRLSTPDCDSTAESLCRKARDCAWYWKPTGKADT